MSGVVLRCPNCGTTRATPGECDACHEAEVRYFCTNHTPGRWLEAAACSLCGAVFGAPARPSAPAPAPVRRPRTTTGPSIGRSVPSPTRAPTPAPPPTTTPWTEPASRSTGPLPPADHRMAPGVPDERMPAWQALLLAAARARAARREIPRGLDDAGPRRGSGGCLFRLVVIVVLIVVALAAAPVLLGGALLRMLGGY